MLRKGIKWALFQVLKLRGLLVRTGNEKNLSNYSYRLPEKE